MDFKQNDDDDRRAILPIKRYIYMQNDETNEIKPLIENVDIDKYGDELMYCAVEYKQSKIIDLLVKKGVQI